MIRDRAAALTPTVLAMLREHLIECLNSPALRVELTRILRDEFADIKRESASDLANPTQ
jgi:hypothetical protein